MAVESKLEELDRHREEAFEMGGTEKVQRRRWRSLR